MNIHPLIVHFPIALLSFYTLLEFLGLFSFAKKRNLKTTKILLLLGGIAGGSLALQTGELAAEIFSDKSMSTIIWRHQMVAQASLRPYYIVCGAYILEKIRGEKWGQKYRQQGYLWIKKYFAVDAFLDTLLKYILLSRKWYIFIILACLGFILLSITGAIGGGLVYGPDADPLTKMMFDLLQ